MAYGIDDSNKQKVPVYSKDEADGAFATKQEVQNGYAPKNHATGSTTYGIGTGTAYGHVKLGAITGRTPSQNGVALDKASGDVLYQMAQSASKYPQLPIGGIAIHVSAGSAALMSDLMGYGTWEYVGIVTGEIWNESTHAYDDISIGFAWKRVT